MVGLRSSLKFGHVVVVVCITVCASASGGGGSALLREKGSVWKSLSTAVTWSSTV